MGFPTLSQHGFRWTQDPTCSPRSPATLNCLWWQLPATIAASTTTTSVKMAVVVVESIERLSQRLADGILNDQAICYLMAALQRGFHKQGEVPPPKRVPGKERAGTSWVIDGRSGKKLRSDPVGPAIHRTNSAGKGSLD